jgi:SAM-dependent methyltransferase
MPDWDAKYAAPQALFGDAPNEYVRRIATRADFHATTALCLADGDGRNGAWLAGRGLSVTGVDSSAVATRKALDRDRAAGVAVERIVADIADWVPQGRCWQSVFLIYLQSEPVVRARALRLASESLEPGGWLVLEVFARTSNGGWGSGPKDTSVLYDLAEIEAATSGLDVIEALEGRVLLDEGVRHQGMSSIIRFAARRPH